MTPALEFGPEFAKDLHFSEGEYRDRVRKVQRLMREQAIDTLLIHHFPSIFYLTGLQNLHVYDHDCAIVPADGEVSLLVPQVERYRALYTSWLDTDRIFTIPRFEEAGRRLADILIDQGLDRGRIALEKRAPRAAGLSVHTYETLCKALPAAEIVDGWLLVERVKLVKSSQEMAYLRQAGAISTVGQRAARAAARSGSSENDLAAAAYSEIIKAGSDYMTTPVIVASGPCSSISHSTHQRRRLQDGDLVVVELGGCVNRYTAPCTRTIFIGRPPDDALRVAEACLANLQRVLAMMRPGASTADVAEEAAKLGDVASGRLYWPGIINYSVGAGFPPAWGDHAGAVGSEVAFELEAGMVFHAMAVLSDMGRYGVFLSDTVLITESGGELLTTAEHEVVRP